jgi:hypothetical protein
VHQDPLGGQFKISIVREAQFAVEPYTVERKRTDIEDNFNVFSNGDGVAFAGHLAVRPGGWIRPEPAVDRVLSLDDGMSAEEEKGCEEQ